MKQLIQTFTMFFIKCIIIGNNNCIQEHVDCSIGRHTNVPIMADRVTVLYLRVPSDMIGGKLNLFRPYRIETVKPETGKLVTLNVKPHAVEQVITTGKRISLVLESYYLDEVDKFAKVPKYTKEV